MKRFLCLMLAFALVFSAALIRTAAAATPINSGNEYIDAFVNFALGLDGYSASKLGLSGDWCGKFVNYCAQNCGLGLSEYIPNGPSAHNLLYASYPMEYGYRFDAETYYFFDDMTPGLSGIPNCHRVNVEDFTPRPGDIVCLRRLNSRNTADVASKWSHAGIVYRVTSTKIYIVHGNWGMDGNKKLYVRTTDAFSRNGITYTAAPFYCIAGYTRPKFPEPEELVFNVEGLFPGYVELGKTYPFRGWVETNKAVGRVDVTLTKDGGTVGGVCWYPTGGQSRNKVYFSDVTGGLSFMDTAGWTLGSYTFRFEYYDEQEEFRGHVTGAAAVMANPCSHPHEVSSFRISEPTCTEPGELWTYCDQCHIPMTQIPDGDVPALGHTPGVWETVLNPTETETGLRELRCVVCDEVISTETLPCLDPNAMIEYEVIYAQGINLRSEPSINGDVIGTLSRDTRFYVYDGTQVQEDPYTWAYVLIEDGRTGYVAIQNESLVKPVSGSASAPVLVSERSDSETGHIYRLYRGNFSWEYAKNYAESLGTGWTLACMDGDSANEQGIIESMVVSYDYACWLGGHNLTGGWSWLSGAPIDPDDARWDEGEPSGVYGSSTEKYLGIYANDRQTSFSTARKWNDFQLASSTPRGFVAEYAPPIVEPLTVLVEAGAEGTMYVDEPTAFTYAVYGGVEPYARIEYEWFYMDGEEKYCVSIGELEETQDILWMLADQNYAETMYLMIEAVDAEGNMMGATASIRLVYLAPAWEVVEGRNVFFAGQTAQVHVNYDFCEADSVEWQISPFDGEDFRIVSIGEEEDFTIETTAAGVYCPTVRLTNGHETVDVATYPIYVLDEPAFRLPAGVRVIGQEAFREAAVSGTLVIPAGVERIEAGAFDQCGGLSHVVILGDATQVEAGAFQSPTFYCPADSEAAHDLGAEGHIVVLMYALPAIP